MEHKAALHRVGNVVWILRRLLCPPQAQDSLRSLLLTSTQSDQGTGLGYQLAAYPLIRETLLGPEHPQVAISLNHLALLCEAQQDYARAKLLYLRVLTIRRKIMGRDNPKVLLTEAYYASLLQKMGFHEEAA